MLQASLQYNGSMTVKVAAIKAATAFLVDNEGNTQTLKYFQPIMADIIRVLKLFLKFFNKKQLLIELVIIEK